MNPSQKTKADAGETSKPTAENVPVSITKNGELVTISLRDYFAAKAMQSELSNPNERGSVEAISRQSYQAADSMLKVREQ